MIQDRIKEKTTAMLFQKALSVKLNGNAYWKYVSELRSRGSKETFLTAKDLCLSSHKQNRILGIDVLCQLRIYDKPLDSNQTAESKPYRQKQSINLIRPMLQDNRKEVLLSAIYALGHLHDPDRARLISPFAKNRNSDVRYAVAFALGGDERPLAIKTLLDLTEDKDSQVRDWATFGIGSLADARKVNSSEVREALFRRLNDSHMDTRGEAMVGLAKRGDRRVVEYIKRELSSESPRVYALDAAEAFAEMIYLPELKQLLKSCKNDDSYWCRCLKRAFNACQPKELKA